MAIPNSVLKEKKEAFLAEFERICEQADSLVADAKLKASSCNVAFFRWNNRFYEYSNDGVKRFEQDVNKLALSS